MKTLNPERAVITSFQYIALIGLMAINFGLDGVTAPQDVKVHDDEIMNELAQAGTGVKRTKTSAGEVFDNPKTSQLLVCYQFSTDNPFVQAAMEATKEAAEKTKSMTPQARHKFPIPHVHVWNVWIALAMKMRSNNHTVMQAMQTSLQGVGTHWEEMIKTAKDTRICRMFTKTSRRVEVNFQEGSPAMDVWENIVCPCMVEADEAESLKRFTELLGIAPKKRL